MIRSRALESTGDLCCLPSPHRIPQSVAGMAFNFSEVKIAPQTVQPVQRKAHVQTETARDQSASARIRTSIACFAGPQFSMAT